MADALTIREMELQQARREADYLRQQVAFMTAAVLGEETITLLGHQARVSVDWLDGCPFGSPEAQKEYAAQLHQDND